MNWQREIDELHEFFEAYFLGHAPIKDLGRVDEVLHEDFTMTGPDGETRNRATIMQMLHDGHAHTTDLAITTSGHRLIHERDDAIVAQYVEHHAWPDGRANERQTTVVFVPDSATPNALAWLHAQETWVGREA